MKKLLLILFVLPLFTFGQFALESPYRVIPNDIASWTQGTGTYVNGGTGAEAYIQCSVAGTYYIQSNQAYGEWYFDLYKGADANTSIVKPIIDVLTAYPTYKSYQLYFDDNEAVKLWRVNLSGILTMTQSANSYISINTWYSIRITRTSAGVFTTYIKGGAFGNEWVKVSVSSGTNPYTENTFTTNNYFVIDLDAGDRIRNVKFSNGTTYSKSLTTPYRIIPNDASQFTAGTGTYTTVGSGVNAYINCSSSGTAFIQSNQSYGEWYFDLYKGADANFPIINYISSSTTPTNNYYFWITGTERVEIDGNSLTLMRTNTSYVATNGVWYSFKITRSSSGVTYTYIKGGTFGSEWVLINSSGGGSNPFTDNTYTTSNYFILDLDVSDRIRNIKFKASTPNNYLITEPYRIIPNDVAQWTVSSGSFANGGSGVEAYVSCTNTGVAYLQSNKAYGEWQFDFYRNVTASDYSLNIINTLNTPSATGNGYYFSASSTKRIALSLNPPISDLMYSNTNYYNTGIWYSIKITRSASGVFYEYIKGGSFGSEWYLVSTSGGGGSNPATNNSITSSNYIVISFFTGDRIRNLKIKQN